MQGVMYKLSDVILIIKFGVCGRMRLPADSFKRNGERAPDEVIRNQER